MEFMSRGRPAPATPHQPAPATHGAGGGNRKQRMPNGIVRWVTVVGAVVVLLLALWLISGKLSGNESSHVSSNQYQAVFLTNNQVYFGKITELNKRFIVLEDVFYVETPSAENQTSGSNTNYTLRKLGSTELHSPEDKMIINREQVTFWENLKDSGQVTTKINEYKANPDAANQQTGVPQQGTQQPTNNTEETNP